MLKLVLQFMLSAAVIVVAGTYLTRCANAIAERTQLGKVLVGGLFLAAATSLPELSVVVSAVRMDLPDLAVGNLFGACLLNLLILAIADLLHRGQTRIFSPVSGEHALAAALSVGLIAIASLAIFLGPRLAPYAVGEFGAGVLMIVVFYLLGVRTVYYNQRVDARSESRTEEQSAGRAMALSRALAGYLISALVLLVAAPFLAKAADEISEVTGLGNTFVGTTLVALCTTLPELVATVTSVRMGAIDLAIGNIFGSNALNIVLLAPLDLVFQGPLLASVSQVHVLTGLAVILVTSVAVAGQLYQVEHRKKIIEPDAFAVIGLVFLSFFLLYIFRGG